VTGLKRFALFWYDFVVGDDWMIAAGVVAAIAATHGLHRDGLHAWWLLPPVVVLILAIALTRANRRAR
jgi:hypothetical protein